MAMTTNALENSAGGDNDADAAAGFARDRPEILHPSPPPLDPVPSAPPRRSSILKPEATDSGRDTAATRKVSFDSVDIRAYDRCVGDNPSCSCGAPVSG